MAIPYSGLVALPFWCFNPATRIGSPAMRVGIAISQTFGIIIFTPLRTIDMDTFKTTFAFGLIALLVSLSTATAEIPKKTQEGLKKAAPEKLEIEVTKVSKKRRLTGSIDLEVEARVIRVEGSETGLKPKDTVVIRYWIHNPNKPAPSHSGPIEIKKGKKYKAYLGPPTDDLKRMIDKSRKVYFPRAASGSFVLVPASDAKTKE